MDVLLIQGEEIRWHDGTRNPQGGLPLSSAKRWEPAGRWLLVVQRLVHTRAEIVAGRGSTAIRTAEGHASRTPTTLTEPFTTTDLAEAIGHPLYGSLLFLAWGVAKVPRLAQYPARIDGHVVPDRHCKS